MMFVFENEYACSSVYFQIPIVAFLNKGLSKTISTGRMQHFPFNSWSNHTHEYINYAVNIPLDIAFYSQSYI